MRKTISIGLLLAVGYAGLCQEKTLVQSIMLRPKVGEIAQFENSLKIHNQKFHGAADKVYVFQIITGARMGFYQIAWPPTSWADLDNQKPNPAHEQDVQNNIAAKLAENDGMMFTRRVDSVSHGDQDWSIAKTQVSIWHMKRGKTAEWLGWVKKMKMAFDGSNDPRNYTIYVKQMAGTDAQVILISRFKNGWKEMESGYYTPIKDIYTKAYSAAEWEEYMKAYNEMVESTETYLRVFRPDLSSK